ncbi:MAG TPA: triose-phosphate isomerase [Candidatus Faecalibacterium faecipullorum]|uniref:Triosephosphate isomerase n=1 Tax=Candidatus Faecalibacterium faecipullorum TaxID=2838578 RepID=A0A9D2MGZ4_9FIRM|nr:triose-phosphate isomerase [Candidatus Faecalibacterium faecipullorum]
MDKAKRKAVIAGNWKMNKTAAEAARLIDELIPAVKDASCEVVICTPYTDLVTAVEKTRGTNIRVGAENVHFEASGAYTGEVSAEMLTDLGVEYVIVGHSERRQYFAETDQTVNKRARAALHAGLKTIICVGESLQQREEGVTEELVRMQTKIALRDVTAEQMANVIIAYEPVWAIGTGRTATADQAEEVCAQIRKVIGELYGEAVAEAVTIQYGGSMNAKNCEELVAKKNVDGGLIGGASLKAADFAVIVSAASNG